MRQRQYQKLTQDEGFVKGTDSVPKVFYHGSDKSTLRANPKKSLYLTDDPSIASTYGSHLHKFVIKDPGARKKCVVRGKSSSGYGERVDSVRDNPNYTHKKSGEYGMKGAESSLKKGDLRADGKRVPLTDRIAKSHKNRGKSLTIIKNLCDPSDTHQVKDSAGRDISLRPSNVVISHDNKGRKYLGVSKSVNKEFSPYVNTGIQEKPLSGEVKHKIKKINQRGRVTQDDSILGGFHPRKKRGDYEPTFTIHPDLKRKLLQRKNQV